MLGLMQDRPLLISSLIDHAAANHGGTEIVSVDPSGAKRRSNWAELALRSRKLAAALGRLGVAPGERVASLAWNNLDHLTLYFGVTGAGVVLHTVNPRLFAEQVRYIIDHGGARFVFVDPDLLPVAEAVAAELPGVTNFVILCAADAMPHTCLPDPLCFESLLEAEDGSFEWPTFDENSASTLCYTSGTTGNPKGVLYSHRSTLPPTAWGWRRATPSCSPPLYST